MKDRSSKKIARILARYASGIEEIWLDVDGVMTRQGGLAIYDVSDEHTLFERRDGIQSIRLVPCDECGQPTPNVVEYVAGLTSEPIMEGYCFDTRDGHVIETAVKAGIPVFFISGRNSPAVLKRAINLGAIPFLGEKDKVSRMLVRLNVLASRHALSMGLLKPSRWPSGLPRPRVVKVSLRKCFVSSLDTGASLCNNQVGETHTNPRRL